MDVGLTTAVFGSKTQTAIANKNADLRRRGNSTPTGSSGRRVTVATKQSATATPRGRSPRETTPTRTGGLSSAAVRSEPLRHTLVRQASPKTKVAGAVTGRSRTPSRALSPTGERGRNGGRAGKTPTSAPITPSHIPKSMRRPISPLSTAHTATGMGPKPSGIPTPSRSKISKTSPRPK